MDAWGYTGYLRFDEMRYYFDTVKKKSRCFPAAGGFYGEESWWLKEANLLHLVVPDWHIIVTVKDVQGKYTNANWRTFADPLPGYDATISLNCRRTNR